MASTFHLTFDTWFFTFFNCTWYFFKSEIVATSMYFWLVSWLTIVRSNSHSFWSTKKKLSGLRDRTKNFWSVSDFFSASLSIRRWTKKSDTDQNNSKTDQNIFVRSLSSLKIWSISNLNFSEPVEVSNVQTTKKSLSQLDLFSSLDKLDL